MIKKINTRERILEQGARIFVEKGYHKATTREICAAAETNITAIYYYFKDKAGLYRTIFEEPFTVLGQPQLDIEYLLSLSTHAALISFYTVLLKPFVEQSISGLPFHHTLFKYMHELIAREQFDPTNLVDDLIARPAEIIHKPLNLFLCHKLGSDQVDDEVNRLGFAITGLGFSLIHQRRIVRQLAPNLVEGDGWVSQMFSRSADFACAIIDSEITRRVQVLK